MVWTISVLGCVEPEGGWAGEPAPAEVGEPVGPAVTAVVGPDGGDLVSADGVFRLRVPAGALAEETELSVQAITNTAWGGIGDAWRLAPAIRFDAPVTVEAGWTEAEEAGTAPELLGIAVQDPDGWWMPFPDGAVDPESRTLSVETDEIGAPQAKGRGAGGSADFARHWRLSIDPAEATVKRRGLQNLKLVACTVTEDFGWPLGEEGGALGPPAPYTHGGPVTWAATLGTVSGGSSRATYTAPSGFAGQDDQATATFAIGAQTFRPRALIHIADDLQRWVGISRESLPSAAGALSIAFDLTWERDHEEAGKLWYVPTGRATLTPPTSCVATPLTHDVVSSDGVLIVDTTVEPPTYSGIGTMSWMADMSCGGGPTVATPIAGTFLGGLDPLGVLGTVKFERRGDKDVAVIRDAPVIGGITLDWEFFGE